MRIAIVTAGGAGMFCGSCMLDNTLARALMAAGADVTLVPTYTPIRTDEDSASLERVFFGGINVYLDAKIRLWRKLPSRLVRWLNHPRVISLATRFSVSNDAKKLGDLTVAMLDGPDGPERRAVDELVAFLADDLKPDAVLFSNIMLSGVMPALRSRFDGAVYCLLQGDDIFLDALTEPWASQAMQRIRGHAPLFDGMIVHSRFYRDKMAAYVGLSADRFHQITPGIDLADHTASPPKTDRPFTVGYFARVCPEKGFHLAVEAFGKLRDRIPDARMRAAGYLGKRDRRFFRRVMKSAGRLGSSLEFCGSPPGRDEKIRFLNSLDVLTVPTTYEEPKGLYVLEALANGVPVVQPDHGAFPELIERTRGGILFPPGDTTHLASALEKLATDRDELQRLSTDGHANVRARCTAAHMARDVLSVLSPTPASN